MDLPLLLNAAAVALNLVAQFSSLMPKGMDHRLQVLLDRCLDARARLLHKILDYYSGQQFDNLEAAAGGEASEYVRTNDRHADNRVCVMSLMRREQRASGLLLDGLLVALGGFAVALVPAGRSWLVLVTNHVDDVARVAPLIGVVGGLAGFALQLCAILLANRVLGRCKELERSAEFQGGPAQ